MGLLSQYWSKLKQLRQNNNKSVFNPKLNPLLANSLNSDNLSSVNTSVNSNVISKK